MMSIQIIKNCVKKLLHDDVIDNTFGVMNQLRSALLDVSRRILRDLWKRVPNMPVPTRSDHYSPVFDWGGMCRLSKDYLDFAVYEIWVLNDWKRVTEKEFIDFLTIQFSL